MAEVPSPIKIIGTSHISTRSAREIKRAYEEFQPDIIAVELDKQRLRSLLQRKPGDKAQIPLSMMKQVGVVGYLFLLIAAYMQRKLAGVVKVEPGIDMLAAVQLAQQEKKQLLLVDRSIMITLRRLSLAFTWKEKLRIVRDIFTGPFQKQKISVPLDRVPDANTIRTLMNIMKKRYPSIYNVLVIERNIHMAAKLDRVARSHPGKKILLVIGAGHEEDVIARLKNSQQFSIV